MDIFDNELFNYSTDLDFYICNIFYWKQKLINLGFDITLPIDSDILLKKECIDYSGRIFTSGPIFPIVLAITILFGNINYLILFYFLLLGIYLFLSHKITFLRKKSNKTIMLILLFFCPSLIWLSLSPSTDMLASVFWLFAILIFKKYIYVKCNYFQDISPDKPTNYFYIFAVFILLAIFTRPITILVLITCFSWFAFEIFLNKVESKKEGNHQKKTNNYFYGILKFIPISGLILFVLIIHFNLYSKYGGVSSPTGILFWAFSPPAPIGLHETIKIHLKQISENSIFSFLSFRQIIIFSIKSIILLINQSIYGFLSLSGIQLKFPITYENIVSIRTIAGTFKSLFGFLIILPSIFILLNNFIRLKIKNILKKINDINPEYIFRIFIDLIVICHIFTSLFLVPHIRFLTPILPFLLSNLIFHFKKDNIAFKNF